MMLAKIFRELEGGEKKNQVMTMTQMTMTMTGPTRPTCYAQKVFKYDKYIYK